MDGLRKRSLKEGLFTQSKIVTESSPTKHDFVPPCFQSILQNTDGSLSVPALILGLVHK